MTMMTLKIDIGQHRYHKIIVTAVIIVTLSHKNILGGFKNMKKDDYWIEHFRRNKRVKELTKDIIDELIE